MVYISKMLSLAAENSYSAFRGLQASLTPEQANTRDRKGNTALFYTSRHKNIEFCKHLLGLGANPSLVCEGGATPLHYIFKTNNIQLILRCLTSAKTPNLNALDADNKTPLAYCSGEVLRKLKLEDGVVCVDGEGVKFDNNTLLEGGAVRRRESRTCERVSIRLKVE